MITARALYTAHSHNGCGDDWIYLIIIQSQEGIVCTNYESHPESEIPKILYSPQDTAVQSDNCKTTIPLNLIIYIVLVLGHTDIEIIIFTCESLIVRVNVVAVPNMYTPLIYKIEHGLLHRILCDGTLTK